MMETMMTTDYDPYDLGSYGTVLDEDGAVMAIRPPGRQPLLNPDRTPMTVTLLGRTSDTFRTVLRSIQERRSEILNRREAISQDHMYKEDTDTLLACTVAWTIQKFQGKQPFPLNRTNALMIWTDPHLLWLREAALNFVVQDANFLPVVSMSLSNSLGITSASTSLSPAEASSATP
jgi:hypothetical protein